MSQPGIEPGTVCAHTWDTLRFTNKSSVCKTEIITARPLRLWVRHLAPSARCNSFDNTLFDLKVRTEPYDHLRRRIFYVEPVVSLRARLRRRRTRVVE